MYKSLDTTLLFKFTVQKYVHPSVRYDCFAILIASCLSVCCSCSCRRHQFRKEKSTGNPRPVPASTAATPSTSQSHRDGMPQGKKVQGWRQTPSPQLAAASSTSSETFPGPDSVWPGQSSAKGATMGGNSVHSVYSPMLGQERHTMQQPSPHWNDAHSHTGASSSHWNDAHSHTGTASFHWNDTHSHTGTASPHWNDTQSHTAGIEAPSPHSRPYDQDATTALNASAAKRGRNRDRLADCVPYKRQRGVQTAVPASAAGLLPITSKLLSHPTSIPNSRKS